MSSEKLLEVARHMVRAGAAQDMHRTLVTRARRALGRGHATSFFLVYRASGLVLPVAESTEGGKRLHPEAYTQKINAGIIGHVVKTGKTYYAQDVATDPFFVGAGQTAGSELCVPVKFEDEVIAIFNIESAKKHGFDADTIARIELLCDAAGVLMNSGVAQEEQDQMQAQVRGLEEGLAHARARFEGLARLVGDAVVVLDGAGKVAWENGGLAGTAGKEFSSLVADESKAALKSLLSKGGSAALAMTIGKSSRRFDARALPLSMSDGPAGTLLVLHPAAAPKKKAAGKPAKKKKKR